MRERDGEMAGLRTDPLDQLDMDVAVPPAALPVSSPRFRRRPGRFRPVAVEAVEDRAGMPILEGRPRQRTLAREGLHRRALMLADVLAAALALGLALYGAGQAPSPVLLILVLPAIVVVNKAAGLYDRDELVLRKTTLEEAPALLQIAGLFSLTVWLAQSHDAGPRLSSSQVLALWAGTLALLLCGRLAARAIARRLATVERCLVIGNADSVDVVRTKLETSPANAEVVATMELSPLAPEVDLYAFRELVERHHVDRVIVAPLRSDPVGLLDVIRVGKAIGLRVSLIPRLFEVVGSAVAFDQLDGLTILGVRSAGLGRSSRLLKRSFDVLGATGCIVVLAPVMLAIAIAIRLDSPGPVFFRQIRVGRDGRRFRILKFRSMVHEADALKASMLHLNEADGLFKIAEDPRVTRVGRVIRRCALDELPQLFNVWWGDMSLVGPRPLVVDEDAKIIGLDRSRLNLTPGMTGHWQVLGSTRIPMQEMVAIDYLYVAHWSLWNDVKLLLRTIPLVMSRRGV
jgi:exopolysaccharide biosynthesis polyprenyl glycosylphosphotransferase